MRAASSTISVRVAALAALAALTAAGCGSSSSSGPVAHAAATAAAPSCLPDKLNQSAKLPGVPVEVTPGPGTTTADPGTQISFLGVPASKIASVSVTGAHSGTHAGRLRGYSQGDGASFVPARPFSIGEQVTVHAVVDGTKVSFSFGVDTPYPTSAVTQFPNSTAAPADYHSLYTLPGVQVPNLTVTTADRDPGAGDLFTTEGPGPGRYGPMIYAPSGRLIWFDQLARGVVGEDLNVQSFRNARDLTFWEGKVLQLGFGEGEDVVMNSQYQTVATVTGGNGLKADLHEFQIAPHDIAYITAYNTIRCNLKAAGGLANAAIIDATIEEIDMKNGLVRWEWHSLDHVGTGESEFSAPNNSRPWDYFHLNSIDPEPGGEILISARNTWAEYQLAAGTGQIQWRLGGTKSSFKLGPGVETAWQHDARMQPDGQITIFDDGSTPPVHSQSRAVRIALDFKTHQARLVLAYTHPNPPLLGASQGNMQTLPDGNTVVDYGGVPALSEYAKNGSLLFDAHLPFDMASYRGYRYQWSAQPHSPPVLAAYDNNTAEETIVHMSWNGATGVASWELLAGKKPGSLATQAKVVATDFETSSILPKSYAYAAVRALDSSGHVLASSPTVAVKSYHASLP
jgi:hypothetical protein